MGLEQNEMKGGRAYTFKTLLHIRDQSYAAEWKKASFKTVYIILNLHTLSLPLSKFYM